MSNELLVQDINLYEALPKEIKVKLPASLMLLICAVGIIVFFGWYGIESLRLNKLEIRVTSLSSTFAKVDMQVKNLEKEFLNFDKPNKEQINPNEELAKKQKLLNFLQNRKQSMQQGFTVYLETFSREIVNGAWVTDFSINKTNSNSVVLNGKSFGTEPALKFMKGLNHSKLFAHKSFYLSKIAKSANNKAPVSFTLETQGGEV